MSAIAEEFGVQLVLELLNSKVDHPGYQCDRTSWGVEVIERGDSFQVKLLYDIYHMQIMEGDLIRTIRSCHRHFGHYHAAGNPGRSNVDGSQEIAYGAAVAAIEDTEFDGYLGQEFRPSGDVMKALKAALEICRG